MSISAQIQTALEYHGLSDVDTTPIEDEPAHYFEIFKSVLIEHTERTKRSLAKMPADTVRAIKSRYETSRKPRENIIRAMLRGLNSAEAADQPLARMENDQLVELNAIFATTDTVISGLLPDNPKVCVNPMNDIAREGKIELDGYLAQTFSANNVRAKSALAIIDCLASGYGAYELDWNISERMPTVSHISSKQLFFDLRAQTNEAIKWFVAVDVVPIVELMSKLNRWAAPYGGFDKPESKKITGLKLSRDILTKVVTKAGEYPEWLLDNAEKRQDKSVLNLTQYCILWRIYDVVHDTFVVYEEYSEQVLLECDMPVTRRGNKFIPFVITTLAANGVNNEGISDCRAIFNLQRAVTNMINLQMEIASAQMPEVYADASLIDPESFSDEGQHNTRKPGDVKLIKPAKSGAPLSTLEAAFFTKPRPTMTGEHVNMIGSLRELLHYTSNINDPSRGQALNARTATEVAYIDSNMQSRLAGRRQSFYEGLELIAQKFFFLAKDLLEEDIDLLIQSSMYNDPERATLKLYTLQSAEAKFEMVGYNPVQKNPAVILEALHNNWANFSQAMPPENMTKLVEYLLRSLGAPPEVYTFKPQPAQPGQPGQPPAGGSNPSKAEQDAIAALLGPQAAGQAGSPPTSEVGPDGLPLNKLVASPEAIAQAGIPPQ